MTNQEFLNLKNKIEEKKQESLMAEGAIQKIKQDWMNSYGFNTLEEAEKKLLKMKEEMDTKLKRKETLEEKLEALVPEEWK